MSIFAAQIIVLVLFASLSFLLLFRHQQRSAIDVIDDLTDYGGVLPFPDQKRRRFNIEDELGGAGIIDEKDKQKFKNKQKAAPFAAAIILGALSVFIPDPSVKKTILLSFGGLCVGYIYSQSMLRRAKADFTADLVFYLPIVMERIVMAVQAGLDIIPALKAVSELDEKTRKKNFDILMSVKPDPVTQLMALVVKLSDSGISFEQALNDVASMVDSSPLKHAFIHLGVAQREGGELIMPLKELSDSTQLYFQESVEEDIAKMPVKATMPLLCTFAGLIVCFITTPLIQVIELTANTSIPNF